MRLALLVSLACGARHSIRLRRGDPPHALDGARPAMTARLRRARLRMIVQAFAFWERSWTSSTPSDLPPPSLRLPVDFERLTSTRPRQVQESC